MNTSDLQVLATRIHSCINSGDMATAVEYLVEYKLDSMKEGMSRAITECDNIKNHVGVSNMSSQAIVCDMCKAAIDFTSEKLTLKN